MSNIALETPTETAPRLRLAHRWCPGYGVVTRRHLQCKGCRPWRRRRHPKGGITFRRSVSGQNIPESISACGAACLLATLPLFNVEVFVGVACLSWPRSASEARPVERSKQSGKKFVLHKPQPQGATLKTCRCKGFPEDKGSMHHGNAFQIILAGQGLRAQCAMWTFNVCPRWIRQAPLL